MRRGFTLIELLVVILILLMITAVTLPAIRSALEGRKVREAARMVEVFISGARSRAIRSGHSVGVLIQPDEQNPAQCVKLSYAEQPDPYTGDFAKSRIAILGNGGFGFWNNLPYLDAMGNPVPGSTTGTQVFTLGDIGWAQNLAPGDIFTLADDDTVKYRLFAGEPFIDMNGDGVYTTGALMKEPFNDVDGNGAYTPASAAPVDPITGFFTAFPGVTWGQPTALVTYTYADTALASQYMSASGSDPSKGFAPYPFMLGFDMHHAPQSDVGNLLTSPFAAHKYSIVSNGGYSDFTFQFLRRPVITSSASVSLPEGACIDLGANYVDPATKNIVGVPGSGVERFTPFGPTTPETAVINGITVIHDRSNIGSGTLGYMASFRPNPLLDPRLQPNLPTDLISRPIIITFDPSGVVEWIYSFDELHFVKDAQPGTLQIASINFTDFQARKPASPIYLLIGQTELVSGNPETLPALAGGTPPKEPIFNMQDPTSLWVAINPRTGLVSTTENVPPDLTQAPPTTQTAAAPEIQLYLNAQTYKARSLAREALDMGGM